MILKVIKDSIIYRGEINKLDDTFDCDDMIAKSLIERGFAVSVDGVAEDEASEHEVEETLDINMSYQELKKLASDMGIPAKGSKAELIEKIKAAESETEDDEIEADELPNTSMPE